MTFLLDTNVISELRRSRPHGAVVAWLEAQQDESLHISAVTLGEIQAGIELTRPQDPGRAAEIDAWADEVAEVWNILPIDGATYRLWAKLMHRRPDHLYEDALIAATARIHGLTVVTRNISDFENFDVPLFNPFDGAH
ncbi:MAG TPA: type II toxin-antitoxin system VapC family toxin [Bradyrhizobium sp.]